MWNPGGRIFTTRWRKASVGLNWKRTVTWKASGWIRRWWWWSLPSNRYSVMLVTIVCTISPAAPGARPGIVSFSILFKLSSWGLSALFVAFRSVSDKRKTGCWKIIELKLEKVSQLTLILSQLTCHHTEFHWLIKSNFSQMQILVVRQQGSHELMSKPRQNERKRSSQCFHTYLSLYVIPYYHGTTLRAGLSSSHRSCDSSAAESRLKPWQKGDGYHFYSSIRISICTKKSSG